MVKVGNEGVTPRHTHQSLLDGCGGLLGGLLVCDGLRAVKSGVTTNRDTYHHGDLRRAVIKAGFESVEQGAEITLRGLARQVGVNHRAVAREFLDLRGVRAALSAEVLAALRAELLKVDVSDKPLRKALLALAVCYARFGVEHHARYGLLFGPRLNTDGRHPELEVGFQGIFEPFHGILRQGIKQGQLRQHDVFAETLKLGAAVHGFVHLTCLGRWEIPPGELESWAHHFVVLPVDGLLMRLKAE